MMVLTSASSGFAAVAGYYRSPTVHDDQIVFVCEGDLWKVSTAGGVASRLTSHPAAETSPHFSPDGKTIAFTADYQGNDDIYVMPADGGEPKRLTFHPAREVCVGWTPDGKWVLFTARRSGLDSDSTLYKVPVDGGDTQVVKIGTCELASYSPDGTHIAFNQFGWNGTWKRYRGGTSPKIWVGDLTSNSFHEITNTEQAVDQDPMWVGDRIFFLSERKFPVNVWSCKTDGSDAKQITNHPDFDARQADSDGKHVVYVNGADVYLLDPATGQSSRVDITIASDRIRQRPRVEDAAKSLESYDLSNDGKRVAVSTRGEIFNAPSKPGGRTIDVTHHSSGTRERSPTFSPDGKKLCLVTDETGEQQIAIYDAAGKENHTLLTKNTKGWLFAPTWSNDSKHIAFADMTGTLYVMDAETGDATTVDQDKNGEMTEYTFSPDSKWIAYTKLNDERVQQVWISDLKGTKPATVSGGFTNDYSPSWDPKGKYLFLLSNRVFDPVLDELDREFIVTKTAKPIAVMLTKDAKSPFLPDEVLGTDKSDDDKSKATTQPEPTTKKTTATTRPATSDMVDSAEHPATTAPVAGDSTKPADDKSETKTVEVKIDFDGIVERQVEFPVGPANCGALSAADGGKLFYLTMPTRGVLGADETPGAKQPTGALHAFDLKSKKDDTFSDDVGQYVLSRDLKHIAWQKDGDIVVTEVASKPEPGKEFDEKVSVSALPLSVDTAAEWKQIFEEAWRLQRDFYWADNMVGLDWPAMRAKYEALLPRVGSRGELNDLIGQLIGELGTSHTYVFGGDTNFNPPAPVMTGLLGADVEFDDASKLHRFTKVLRPEPWETDIASPLTMTNAGVHDGDYLIAVNGHELTPTDNADAQFENLAGVQVQLTVASKADKSDARDIQIGTLKSDTSLRYADWCRRNREYVDAKTGGKIGYFHLPDMSGPGLVKFVKGFYPQLNKDALIIDDRDNHGGFVSQMMIERLNRKIWAYDRPRRGLTGTYPDRTALGYKCVLINEHAGSDGDIFPDSFRTLGLGPLIGKRTWGGVIGIRMDKGFVDNGMSSQPEYAWWDAKRGWSIENHGVDPDIEVEYSPADYIAGHDPQLDRAIDEMTKMLKEKPIDHPQPPALPIRVGTGVVGTPAQR